MVVKAETKQENNVEDMINKLVSAGHVALDALDGFDQEKIDHIVHQMAMEALDHHMELAKLAVEETGRGVVEDKAVKNIYASEYIWHSIKNDKTVGIIKDDKERQLVTVAEPLGVIAGITPVTNPTSTTIFKSLLAVKTRNPIIFAFHPQAQKCSVAAAKIVLKAAVEAGAPENIIQWIETPSLEATTGLINNDGVASVLATGGPGMVKAAYSTGKPALGVGPGNGPVYIEKTANIKRAVNDILLSKTFDNGMICASENSAVIDDEIFDAVTAEFKAHNAFFVAKKDQKALRDAMFDPKRGGVKGPIPGMSAYDIAKMAGITVPKETKILVTEISEVGPQELLSAEKLCPVLSIYHAKGQDNAFELCDALLHFGGLGHTAAIQSEDDDVIMKFGIQMKASRVIVNTPSALGGIGNMYNEMIPSLTLGTGSWGKNSISHNVSSFDLINVKTIAKRRNNMQWVKLPKVYFEKTSVRYLEDMEDINKVMLITGPSMVKYGYADIVVNELKRRPNGDKIQYEIFSDIEPDPSTNTVTRGLNQIREFQPDTIIALGGGSPLDAAKAMWLFYEHPESSFFGAKQKFLDIRKRTYKLECANKAKFVAIPTTSGTGSEVTPFAVITDSDTHVKYPLADYALTPDVAIVDSQFIQTVPKKTIAESGLDVLAHATESFVSALASDYTRPLSMQAAKLVFDNLEASYNGDAHAREEMHNASTLAGMAFGNAFLGINHSVAHKLGGEFGLAHGLCIAITYPHIIRYNASEPQKFQAWPKYEYFRANKDYADLARYVGVNGSTDEELIEGLIQKFIKLAHAVGIKLSLKANGVKKADFDKAIDNGMAELAYEDQCTTANPKEPLIADLKQIMIDDFDGKGVEK
ncbi:bifunctional acetaldehyde-CoA alcohol dehydrogenase [Paucilactobacillus vaccinostercus DSM 20634]|uniref:Aldehyde-alcohol dehydrogenase n=1 Tax=Paucilactobacillus vaccinostercus DSM 20634 TaxID=1423813 RepID=A0A0R2A5W6_9LACO|nr:bifunctional acetaldehyde-CoA/alcohol dehydrogenase [Paucilactobacillus vaccinostercus]KRM61930.1 bifunctional acetaldehyde-CoA alcohol dehydrogenase [Paucilactobacillus vaccinostercus DSM 20634]